jgi:hypothetical protein
VKKDGAAFSSFPERRAVYGNISYKNKPIDDGILIYYPAPNSFTGEDVIEISCHGGMLLAERVLESVLSAGAVPAEAGEFSKRAFLSGKLSLTEAESIIDSIDANFINNYSTSDSGYAVAGAIDFTGTIGTITGKFEGNYAQSNRSYARGGAIDVNTVTNINADFILEYLRQPLYKILSNESSKNKNKKSNKSIIEEIMNINKNNKSKEVIIHLNLTVQKCLDYFRYKEENPRFKYKLVDFLVEEFESQKKKKEKSQKKKRKKKSQNDKKKKKKQKKKKKKKSQN